MISWRLLVRAVGLCAGFVAGAGGMRAATALLAKGEVLEAVRCEADGTRSYALYVPTSLDYTRPTPVVFCLDPEGSGDVPVRRFEAAAEKFGYVIAGSNDFQAGRADNAQAVAAMIEDIERRFTVDRARVYAAGFSDGARAACELAQGGIVRGAIAVGALFGGRGVPGGVTFPVFGAAGVMDYNYIELQQAARELAARGNPHRVMFHLGAHEWLPVELAEEALAWLNIQAMQTGALARDPVWIQAERDRRAAQLLAEPALERARSWREMIADFRGLVDVRELERAFAVLRDAPEVREALDAELAAERREEGLAAHLQAAMRDRFATGVKKTAARLRAQASAEAPSPERAQAARVLEKVYVTSAAEARAETRASDPAEAAAWWEMLTLLRPDRGVAYFELAACEAQRGNAEAALDALQRGAAAGFSEADRVERADAFRQLRSEPAFLELVSAMRARARRTDG